MSVFLDMAPTPRLTGPAGYLIGLVVVLAAIIVAVVLIVRKKKK